MAAEKASQSNVVVVLDVETTGLKDDDRVVQIACLKLDKNGPKTAWTRYINPEMKIERQRYAEKIHKIAPELLLTKPTFQQIAENLLEFLDDVDVMVCHNALFDWSMLWNEFKRINHPNAQDFAKKFQWLDVLRLSILHYQKSVDRFKPMDYRLGTLKATMNVSTESLATELSSCVDECGDTWRGGQHDAMYDVFTTYGIIKYCMGDMINVDGLLLKHPKALLDTSLFIDMQKLQDEKRTSDQDLTPFAFRAKEYFTTARPRGKVLKELAKDYLHRMTQYHEEDYRTDRRIVLIYKAAYLDPPCAMPTLPVLQKQHTQQPNQHNIPDKTPTKGDDIKEDVISDVVENSQEVTQHDVSFEAITIANDSIRSDDEMTAIKKSAKSDEKKDPLQMGSSSSQEIATNESNNGDTIEPHSERNQSQNILEEKVTSSIDEKGPMASNSTPPEETEVQNGRDSIQNEDKDMSDIDKLAKENRDSMADYVKDDGAQNCEKDQMEDSSPSKKMKMADFSENENTMINN